MDWIASALTWGGNALLIWKKSWVAFAIFLVANSIWVYWWVSHQQWSAAVLCGTFLLQNLWGIYSWRKQEQKKSV